MRSRLIGVFPVAVIFGATVAAVFAATAFAQTAPVAALTSSAEPTLTSATTAAGGDEVVSGGGCVARAQVRVQIDGVALVTTRSTVTGRYRVHVIVPVSIAPGPHRVTVLCARPGGATTEAQTVAVTVALPRTGAASERDAVLGGALGLFGLALVLLAGARRRTRLA